MVRALAALLAISLASGSAEAKVCRVRDVKAAQMPGIDVGVFDAAVRKRLPQARRCGPANDPPDCVVFDQLGYKYLLMNVPLFDGKSDDFGFTVSKSAQRSQRIPLPVGLVWGETRTSALAKLRRVGSTFQYYGDTDPERLRTDYCFRARNGEPFAFDLEFSKAGRLTGVSQEMEYQW